MIKLIASDMDGTFLHSNGLMPKEFDTILKKLKDRNIIFSAASGRPYLTLLKTFEGYENDILFIADNGAHIVYKGKEIAVHTLSNEIVHAFLEITRALPNSYSVVCTTNGAFIESTNPAFIKELEKYYVKYTVVDDLSKVNERIIKFTVCDLNGAEHNSYPHFNDFKSAAQVCVAGEIWLDIMPLGVNKGAAIKEIQTAFNINFNETMAFGDYLNDLEMMKNAYYSYAMANAHKELFGVARFQTETNDNNGVILKIQDMLNNTLPSIE